MKAEMPKALITIEKAADLLEMACRDMKQDPYSQAGRDRLISGSRAILQGTTSMLVVFDESQVRKICRDCKKVLDYLAVAEVIETMEDLVQFVKDLSPCLSKVCQDVDTRRNDLLNPYQRDSLGQHLDQVKTLAPILICSMKIFIQILGNEGRGTDEAIENRNYLSKRMTDEIGEIVMILEESARTDNGTKMTNGVSSINTNDLTFHEVMKKLSASLASKSSKDAQLNQQLIQHIVDLGFKISDGFDSQEKRRILQICNDLDQANRQHNNNDPRARQQIADLVRQLQLTVNEAVIGRIIHDMADITTPLKHFTDAVLSSETLAMKRMTVDEKSQTLKVFSNRLAKTANLVGFANARDKRRSTSLQQLSTQIQTLTPQLINAGTIRMNYPENRAAEENFENLKKQYNEGIHLIRDLCEESVDTKIFLQQTKAQIQNAIQTCEGGLKNRNVQTVIENSALAARLANRLLMVLNKEADNSEDPNLRKQVETAGERLKSAITPFVTNSKALATNLNDGSTIKTWRHGSQRLVDMVNEVARLFDELNMYGFDAPRQQPQVVQPVQGFQEIPIEITPPQPNHFSASPPIQNLIPAPPRPPLPSETRVPQRPPVPNGHDTDDEDGLFSTMPSGNRPIHHAAHGLYQEVRQWDHTDNEIIAAAKKIAFLMAHLSELVQPGRGTKRELLACARGVAEVSERITELAKEYGKHCTDKKIRTNLLQVCEKIPTLGTQLRVLTTVKATMLSDNVETPEDQEAMDMLVFNAEKLNQAVRETVGAAESASIRVRSDAGFKLKWVRKSVPWINNEDD
ncbi:vinculin-like [Tigriopus californicus]|uniref:vinculin-like n=1 Tax=Tigriopus californicus TaxID=6832 RepID=UPI0027DA0478|nr:vinculin-like [Tigriopus californicus]